MKTVQFAQEQAPEETNISPVIWNWYYDDQPVRYLAKYISPTAEDVATSMTVYEAELNANSQKLA